MFLDEPLQASDLGAPEPATADEPGRAQSELSHVSVSLDVYVWRLFAITRVEKAAVRTSSQHSRHRQGHSTNVRAPGVDDALSLTLSAYRSDPDRDYRVSAARGPSSLV